MTNVNVGDKVRASFDGYTSGEIVIEGVVYKNKSGALEVGGWTVDGSKPYLVDLIVLEYNETTKWLNWLNSWDWIDKESLAHDLAATGLKAPEVEVESSEIEDDDAPDWCDKW